MEPWQAGNLTSTGGRAKGNANLRTETISVRLEPRTRYLAELAARAQRRTLSSFIEFAIDNALVGIALNDTEGKYHNLKESGSQLWDVFTPDKFVKLALRFPELLNHHEQILWKLIKENGVLWKGVHSKTSGEWTWVIREEHVSWQRIREYWELLNRIASGEVEMSKLPTWRKYPIGDARNDAMDDEDIPF